MIDKVEIKKYDELKRDTISEIITKDLEVYKKDFEIIDIRLIKKFLNCDGCSHVEVMYLLKNK